MTLKILSFNNNRFYIGVATQKGLALARLSRELFYSEKEAEIALRSGGWVLRTAPIYATIIAALRRNGQPLPNNLGD
jgi:hypothetical protein